MPRMSSLCTDTGEDKLYHLKKVVDTSCVALSYGNEIFCPERSYPVLLTILLHNRISGGLELLGRFIVPIITCVIYHSQVNLISL